jgi:copper oxidase (laccase) domain-containing protein
MIEASNLSALDNIRHGFFTREGGVSEGVFASLNCGFSSGDDAAQVSENRARALRRLGLAANSLRTVRQVHGARVLAVSEAHTGHQPVEADALVTDRPAIALGVVCADCPRSTCLVTRSARPSSINRSTRSEGIAKTSRYAPNNSVAARPTPSSVA